jgi:hypothetical protein
MHPAFFRTEHRPWPLRRGPWTSRQTWNDLLFLHWPVSAARLRPLVPADLEIQERDGTSWVGLVPFNMTGVMLRGLPDLPWISAFPEMNLRLYVEHDGKPGVWFVSLDAANPLAVWAARRFFHLPYFHARMSVAADGPYVDYRSMRLADGGRVRFRARYRPTGPPFEAPRGSLEHFLTERYCLYAASPGGALHRVEIHHAPWPLQPAEALIEENEVAHPQGVPLEGPPALLHFSRRLDVVIWPRERIG